MAVEVEKELVELRRWDGGAGEHGVRLAAVVDLVLEEVGEEASIRSGTSPCAPRSITTHPVEVVGREAVAEGDQPAVGRGLRGAQRRGSAKSGQTEGTAGRPVLASSASR